MSRMYKLYLIQCWSHGDELEQLKAELEATQESLRAKASGEAKLCRIMKIKWSIASAGRTA